MNVVEDITEVLKNSERGDEYTVSEIARETNIHYMTVDTYLDMIEYIHSNVPAFTKTDNDGVVKISVTKGPKKDETVEKGILDMFYRGSMGRSTSIPSDEFRADVLERMISSNYVIAIDSGVYLSRNGIIRAAGLANRRKDLKRAGEINLDPICEFRIPSRESQDEEWKESWRTDNLATLSAFAGGRGGKMIIGKKDDGTVVGVRNAKHLLKEIPDTVNNKLNFLPEVNLIAVGEKECIEIIVKKQDFHPPYDQKFYLRSGSTTHEVSGKKLKRLMISELDIVWTDEIEDHVRLSDISAESVRNFVILGKNCGRICADADENDVEGTLRRFKLMTDQGITLAGALLFHKDPRMVFLDAVVKIGLFSKNRTLLMDDLIDGPVFEQTDKAMEMIRLRYVQPRFDTEGAFRVDRYRYPLKAIKEAIQNAVIHRAYHENGEITVRVYEDSVEVYNPGYLPKDWTVDKLLKEHESQSPNENMANIFYSANMIERWGQGIKRMFEECRKNNNPDPEFHIDDDGIRVIFRSGPWHYDNNINMRTGAEDLTSSEADLYRTIFEGDYTTNEALIASDGSSERAVRKAIAKLTNMGLIRRKGNTKKGRWEPVAD